MQFRFFFFFSKFLIISSKSHSFKKCLNYLTMQLQIIQDLSLQKYSVEGNCLYLLVQWMSFQNAPDVCRRLWSTFVIARANLLTDHRINIRSTNSCQIQTLQDNSRTCV